MRFSSSRTPFSDFVSFTQVAKIIVTPYIYTAPSFRSKFDYLILIRSMGGLFVSIFNLKHSFFSLNKYG